MHGEGGSTGLTEAWLVASTPQELCSHCFWEQTCPAGKTPVEFCSVTGRQNLRPHGPTTENTLGLCVVGGARAHVCVFTGISLTHQTATSG